MQAATQKAGQLVKEEGRAVGRVDRGMYRAYLSAWGPFFVLPLVMIGLAMSERGMQVGLHSVPLTVPSAP